MPECVLPYVDQRDQFTILDKLVFNYKGQQVVVPMALRKELIEVAHRTNIGIQGSVRLALKALCWPHMS